MSTIWTREELLGLIACWKAAYKAASTGKSYTVQGRTLTRYDLPEIRQQLVYLQGELAALDTGPHYRTRKGEEVRHGTA